MLARRPKNGPEGVLYDLMTSSGWEVTKRGWPDFICYKDDRVIIVEVKMHRGRRLKREQYRIMRILAAAGIACYRWSPTDGFGPILSIAQPDL